MPPSLPLIGPDDPIPDAVVIIPQAPTERFYGDFANLDRPVQLGPKEYVASFVPHEPKHVAPSWTTEPPPRVRSTLWTDAEGKRWQVIDAIRVATEDGSPKHRAVILGEEGAHVRAFIPVGFAGDVRLYRFLGDQTRRYDDATLRMQFAAIGSVELY